MVILTLLFSDVLLAVVIWTIAYALQDFFGHGPLSPAASFSVIPNVAAWMGLCALLGLYPGYSLSRAEKLRRQTYAVVATLAITTIFAVFVQVGDLLSRLVLLSGFLGLLLLAPLNRYFAEWGMMKAGLWGKAVVVLGGSVNRTTKLIRILCQEWTLGLRPVAFFEDKWVPEEGRLEGVPYGGTLTDAINSAPLKQVDTAIFAMSPDRSEYPVRFVNQLSSRVQYLVIVPEIAEITTSGVVARDLGGTFGVEIKHNLLTPGALRIKRMLDLVLTIVGGILILPLLVAIALIISLDSPGSTFYAAQRIGRDGNFFVCIKFRTMLPEAEAMLQQMLEEDTSMREEYLIYHKLRTDPRVTRVGRFLRKTSLDELPQLWNVLRGEMSLVGPRPYLPRESARIGDTQQEVLRVRPGITGPWQVAGRSGISFEERVQMDVCYVRDWSVWLDLVILGRTVKNVFYGHGAS